MCICKFQEFEVKTTTDLKEQFNKNGITFANKTTHV